MADRPWPDSGAEYLAVGYHCTVSRGRTSSPSLYWSSSDYVVSCAKEESEKEELKDFSIVTFNHLIEDKDIGTIGIIGPKRMDYSKIISVMKYISKKLNDDFKNGKI